MLFVDHLCRIGVERKRDRFGVGHRGFYELFCQLVTSTSVSDIRVMDDIRFENEIAEDGVGLVLIAGQNALGARENVVDHLRELFKEHADRAGPAERRFSLHGFQECALDEVQIRWLRLPDLNVILILWPHRMPLEPGFSVAL